VSVGKYESGVTVNTGGTIAITYGGQANAKLATAGANVLTLVAYTNANGDVLWRCGTATAPSGTIATGAAAATTIPAQYLPTSCHS
jgi:hypothetical protein